MIRVPTVEPRVLQLLVGLVSVLCNNVQGSRLLHAVGDKVDNGGTNVNDLLARWLRRMKLARIGNHILFGRTLVVTLAKPASMILILIYLKRTGDLISSSHIFILWSVAISILSVGVGVQDLELLIMKPLVVR